MIAIIHAGSFDDCIKCGKPILDAPEIDEEGDAEEQQERQEDYNEVQEILSQAYLANSAAVADYEQLFIDRLMIDLGEYYPPHAEITSYGLDFSSILTEPTDSVDFVEFEPCSEIYHKRFFAIIGPGDTHLKTSTREVDM